MAYSKNMLDKGVYGIKDLKSNAIKYVGSTSTSFAERWANHLRDYRKNEHCNYNLTQLFKQGSFEFIILEPCNEFTNEEILSREKYYTELYNTFKNGYNIYTGGGSIIKNNSNIVYYKDTEDIIKAREYIKENWINIKIGRKEKDKIINKLKNEFNMFKGNDKFTITIRKLGFNVDRYSDKCHWMIKILNKKDSLKELDLSLSSSFLMQ